VLLQLEHAGQATTLLDDGIALFDESFTRNRQAYLMHLADALTRAGKRRDLGMPPPEAWKRSIWQRVFTRRTNPANPANPANPRLGQPRSVPRYGAPTSLMTTCVAMTAGSAEKILP
jgi:hypothetical protein